MKVLYFQHSSDIGGASWALWQIVQDVVRKHDVVVVLGSDGVLATHLEQLGAKVVICHRLRIMGNVPVGVGWMRNTGWFGDIITWKLSVEAARQVCLQEAPDIVHINTMVYFHLAIGVKQAGPIPVVQHVREHWVLTKWDPRNAIKRQAFKCIDHVFAVTYANARQFGFEGETTIVRDWVDFDNRDGAYSHCGRYGIPAACKIFLLPGGRLKHKGTLVAIRAMRYVKARDAVLLVMGGAGATGASCWKRLLGKITPLVGFVPYSKRIEKEAAMIGLDRVVLVPATKDILPVFKESYAVISPFVEPHFSKPAIEAGWLSKPVIASDYPEIQEAVKDGETGIIVPPGDVQQLANSIDRLAEHMDEAIAMGRRGRAWVCDVFSKEKSLSKICEVYTKMIC